MVSFVEVLQRENLQTKASWNWYQNQTLDTHSSEYPEWQTHWEWHDITDTNCIQWSDNTNCWPSVLV